VLGLESKGMKVAVVDTVVAALVDAEGPTHTELGGEVPAADIPLAVG
jgi:hypothetical protein